jgi:hypothetical protein
MKFHETACFEIPESVHARRFDDELVVLDLAQGEYFALDELGASIWDGLSAGKNLSGLCEGLRSTYEVESDRLREDVAAFIAGLVESGLMRVRRAHEGTP